MTSALTPFAQSHELSFNLRGEGLVHTPTHAIRTFFRAVMDALIFGS